jgi:hypothetical protein
MKVWFDTIRRQAHKIFLASQPAGQGAHSDPKFAGRSDIYLCISNPDHAIYAQARQLGLDLKCFVRTIMPTTYNHDIIEEPAKMQHI